MSLNTSRLPPSRQNSPLGGSSPSASGPQQYPPGRQSPGLRLNPLYEAATGGGTVRIEDIYNGQNWEPAEGPPWSMAYLDRCIREARRQLSVMNASVPGFQHRERDMLNYEA
jgi:hypothetical protein